MTTFDQGHHPMDISHYSTGDALVLALTIAAGLSTCYAILRLMISERHD